MTLPPQLRPWTGFDVTHPSPVGDACRQISAILADHQWHNTFELIKTVADTNKLKPKTIANLLRNMKTQGDIQRTDDDVALSPRWNVSP